MTHDPVCTVKPQDQLPPDKCWRCDLIFRAREDERKRLRLKAQAAYLAAVPARQGRMSPEVKARVAAAALMVRMMTEED